ncbi:MAG: nicotinamide mononucleotide deamidase-related protein [Candidatus Bathyarchaeia archaeon]
MTQQMEIICVGNELLIGKTLNTNAQWMAKRATSLGIMVKRITVVGDDIDEIANAVKEALQRKPKFIITTGGLGPTFDDKTLEGIAKALNRKLEVDNKALAMVKERYEAYAKEGKIEKVELTPSRVKMATIPEGAEPLPNPVGTAPGVQILIDETVLIALPGVPSEMEAIFEQSISPLLRKEAEGFTFFETSIYVDDIMESALAPLIDQAMRDNPYVYIKSHPRGAEKKPHIEIHISTTAKDSKIARERFVKTIAQLTELVQKNGGKIKVPKK